MTRVQIATRRFLPAIAVAAVGGLIACGCSEGGTGQKGSAQKTPPHVVLIIVDTLRADVLGTYGDAREASRELDALAAQSVVFDLVISQCSWTRPSVGTMITGMYPRSLGLGEEKNEQLADGYATVAEHFHDAGYHTVGVTANPNLNEVFNMHQGFDRYVNSSAVYEWMQQREGEAKRNNARAMTALEVFEHAERLVDEAPGAPLYVQLNIMEMYDYKRDDDLRLTRDEFGWLYADVEDDGRRLYLQALRQTSIDVSEFVRKWSARPGWKNCIFVITSDHGEGLDSHPGIEQSTDHGRIVYESQLRVPLIVYAPDRRYGNRRVDRIVRLLDLAPTLLDLAGVTRSSAMQGVSLAPFVRGSQEQSVELPKYAFAETLFRNYDKTAVIGAEWKYFDHRDAAMYTSLNRYELHRLGAAEQGKANDKAEKYPAIAAEMAGALAAWEAAYPRVAATPMTQELSNAERDQLEAVGYLQ